MTLNSSKPFSIGILILDDSTMLTVASILDPLRAANRLSKRRFFEWQIYSAEGGPISLNGGFKMECDSGFSHAAPGDLLIVIASFNQHIHANSALISVLRRQQNRFKTIAGVEAGTWALARAGLTDNRKITTHWEDLELLESNLNEAEVVADRYVMDGNIWTCGGASPGLDMMLELISQKAGKPLALEVASVFIYDQTHAATDSQPSLSLGKLEEKEPRLTEAVRLMERNLDTPLPIATIAKQVGLSTKMLELIFQRHLDLSPGKYYLRLRLLTARKLLSDSGLSIQEIAVRSGFASQSSFSRTFKKNFGGPPSSLRRGN